MPRLRVSDSRRIRPARAGLLGLVTVGALLMATWWSVASLRTQYVDLNRRAAISTIDAVPVVVQGALVLTLVWATLVVSAGLRVVRRTPRDLPAGLAGRVALVLLVTTMTTTLTAHAAEAGATTLHRVDAGADAPVPGFQPVVPHHLATSGDDAPAPGWTAPVPAPTGQRCAVSAPLVTGCAGSAHDGTEVVVRRGDNLWILVGRQLHTDDPAVIAAEWPRWYAHNRHLIGPDPDLLQIGRILHSPTPTATTFAAASPGDPR